MGESHPFSRASLFVNSRSRRGSEWFEQARDLLKAAGIELDEAQRFTKLPALLASLKSQAKPGRLLIVGGGDGTLSAAASVLADTEATLGVMPLGTGNAFARDLKIPTSVEAASEVLTQGQVTHVDLGICNEHYFINVVTCGLTATVARTLTVPMKRRFGRFVYAVAIARALQDMRPFALTLNTENGRTEVEAVQLVIGNGRFHAGPLPLSPGAAITSGTLQLYAVELGSRAAMIKYALLLPTGLQGVLRTVHSEATSGGTAVTKPKRSIVQDGEIIGKTPIRFAVAPGALRVMTPAGFQG